MSIAWEDRACRDVEPEVFFPGPGDGWRDAQAICLRCPIRTECLEWIIQVEMTMNADPYGVFGGTTSRQRELLIKQRTEKRCRDCSRMIPRTGGRIRCDSCSASRRGRSAPVTIVTEEETAA